MAGARELLKRIRANALGAEFRARDVYVKGWTRLASSEQAHRAVALLSDFDYLRELDDQTGGRPTKTYTVNPRVLA
jgi:hypothetical protein